MKRIICATALTLLAVGSLPAASAQALTVTVDCNRGQTIANALKQGDSRKPLVMVVRGTCNEHVSISRDDVTLRADPTVGGTVNGPNPDVDTIVVAASRIMLDGMVVTGGRDGIVANLGRLALNNTTIQGAGNRGLMLDSGASVRVADSRIISNSASGVQIQQNSVLTSIRTKIAGNGNAGVIATTGSEALFIRSEISNNGSDGIGAYMGVVLVVNSGNISYNGARGVTCNAHCTMQLADSKIQNNTLEGVLLHMDSLFILSPNQPENYVTDNGGDGDVNCYDEDSSINHTYLLIGDVNPSCRAF
jgi:hypothetical protein